MAEVLVEFENAMDALRHLKRGDPVVVMRRGHQFHTYVEGTALVQDNFHRRNRFKLVLSVRVKGVVMPYKHNAVKKIVTL